MNPMQLLKMKSAWDRFQSAHPKFPLFLNSVMQNGIHEGTILEFKVTEPDVPIILSTIPAAPL